jgi:hypothetical protein
VVYHDIWLIISVKENLLSEYKKYHSSDKMKKERALRNKNRRAAIRQGKVKKGDGKHIDHKDGNPKNNGKKNLRVISGRKNRKKQ